MPLMFGDGPGQVNRKSFCNEVGKRYAGRNHLDPNAPPAPDSGFTPGGQSINSALDRWDASQTVKGTVPSGTVVIEIAEDQKLNISDANLDPALKYEVPLR
jgi:hypothetical protein